jgi:hypothetical protein
MAPPDHVAELYSVPPAEFTATRNRIAAELRDAGRADEARAVARLRRPSSALWAVNRLASVDRKGVAAFIEAVEHLRRTQLRDPREAADALRAQRATLDALVTRARDVLLRSGLSASQPILRRIADTLLGAAIDRQRADTLRRGGLTEELPAPGFEAFSDVRIPGAPLRLVSTRPATIAPVQADHPAEKARAVEADRRQRAAGAEALQRQAADHRRTVAQLEAESAAGRAKLQEVERKLRAARQAARQATTAANRARRKSRA